MLNKSNGVSLKYRWFHFDAMENWIVSRQGHSICHVCNLVCANDCGAMTISWKNCSWFDRHVVHGISHKPLHKYNLRVSSFGSVERISFCHYLWNTWCHDFVFMATTKCTMISRPWHTIDSAGATIRRTRPLPRAQSQRECHKGPLDITMFLR